MVSYIPINLPNEKIDFSRKLNEELNEVFNFTSASINAHVVFNFKSPTERYGEYDFLLFIDIPFGFSQDGRSNYCKWDGQFMNSIAIAVRQLNLPDVIEVDNEFLYNEQGSINYVNDIESDRQELRTFVYDNISNVKHFDIVTVYSVTAPKCSKSFFANGLCFNKDIPLASIISYAVSIQKNSVGRVNALLLNDSKRSATWESFINIFIETAEKYTEQGILTRRKVNSITRKNISKEIKDLNSKMGNNLCIIEGKPGSGKTNTLLLLMYQQVKKQDSEKSHHCRLLTYNNMLAIDLKQILKGIGDFNSLNSSISTLHKFFYNIYKDSPLSNYNINQNEIDKVFLLCLSRVAKFNALIIIENKKTGNKVLKSLFNIVLNKIQLSERKELNSYLNYLLKETVEFNLFELEKLALDYVFNKRDLYLNSYKKRQFLSEYNLILQQLYLMYHDPDAFWNQYKQICITNDVRDRDEFLMKYRELYHRFLLEAEHRFQKEDISVEDVVRDFHTQLDEEDSITEIVLRNKTVDEAKNEYYNKLNRIKRKVNWSKYIFVDEGQDCQLYEKALLLELNGSDDTVVAVGGGSQLIRTARPNDWSMCLNRQLFVNKLSLERKSFRQKGNIISFVNLFSQELGINSGISSPNEMQNKGRVIVDCRSSKDDVSLPLDIINEMYISGKDYGCSNYENLLFLFPHKYIEKDDASEVNVTIDTFGSIETTNVNKNRHLVELGLPEHLYYVDGTVDDKRNLQLGQNSTRCILYESCRGLESWNVLCIDLDLFYYEKLQSRDADDYAISNAELFINREELKAKYAALWCYMAMTRAIDTLYIKLSNLNSHFSSSVLDVANRLGFVEIILE